MQPAHDLPELVKRAEEELRRQGRQPTPEAVASLIRQWRDSGTEDRSLCCLYLLAH